MQSFYDNAIELFRQRSASVESISSFLNKHGLKVAASAVFGYTAYRIYKWPRNLPPGPRNWPVQRAIKNPDNWHLDFVTLGQQYGDIFSFYYGDKLTIVLNSHETIRECFQKRKDFCERVPPTFNYFLNFDDEISGQCYSEKWREQKKFAVQALRTSGFGTPASERKIQDEVDEFIVYLKGLKSDATDLMEPVRFTMANIIASILFNKTYKWGDPEQLQLIEGTHELLSTFGDCHFVNRLAAWLPYWAIKLLFRKTVKTLAGGILTLADYIQDRIEEHRANFDADHTNDFLDIYIKHRDGEEDFTDHRFVCTTMAFLPDAIDTTAYVVLWALLFLGHNPDDQTKAQEQIDAVCTDGRSPSLKDKPSLTYVEAIILETLRLVNIFPTTTSHSALQDTTFQGYNIPKSANILANLYGVHTNPDIFPEPTRFLPSRFLDDKGNLINTDLVIPFGVGRRMCMGEQLTRMELFLVLSKLLHQFNFVFPPDVDKPSLEANRNVISSPQNFLVCAVARE